MSKSARIFSVAALIGLAAIGSTPVLAQGEGEIESDAVWHNRYHALLALSLYGDPAETCPGTFTEATLRENVGIRCPPTEWESFSQSLLALSSSRTLPCDPLRFFNASGPLSMAPRELSSR